MSAGGKRKRLCSRMTKAGRPCRGWAMLGSDPPVCAVHARVTVSPGAPKGNRYALKHGLYQQLDPPMLVEAIDLATAADELRLVRKGLLRMNRLMERDDLSPEQYAVVMGKIVAGAKVVLKLEPAVAEARNKEMWEGALDALERRDRDKDKGWHC